MGSLDHHRGIGAPVIVAFDDPTATAATTFVGKSSNNSAVTATVMHTSEMLKMQVHTVNADGTTGTSGEMIFSYWTMLPPRTSRTLRRW